MQRTRFQLVALASSLLFIAGCDAASGGVGKYWGQLQKELGALVSVLSGGRNPLAKDGVTASPSPSAEKPEFSSNDARNAKANAELLQEVYRAVFVHDPQDRGQFGSLVDTLNQGASFEGIYNGFIHSSDYRRLEVAHPSSTAEALRAFGQELAVLESELAAPTEFSASAAKPLPLPVQPGAASGTETVEYKPAPQSAPTASPSAQAAKPDLNALSERYSQQFMGGSIFTLKRVLGDEGMKVVTAKRDSQEQLARWYAKWSVRMAARNVDFGVALRNKPDEEFHYQWALHSSEDRIMWEVLNRLHRLLNELNKPKP